MTNEDTTDFDEHFAKISSYIVDTLHGVPLEMTEDEKEQFRIQVISNQYAERLLSEAEKTETYRGLSKIDILHTVSIPQLARTIPLKGLNLSLEKYRMPDGVIIEVESSSHYLGSFATVYKGNIIKKLNNGLPILHKVPPKRDYGRYFCIMAEKGGTSHGGLTEKLSPFFHAKKQEVNAYGR